MLDRKHEDIRAHFNALIGDRIVWYETAELCLDDGAWESWPDLPIRIRMGSGRLLAVSWSGFEDLWIADDSSLPFRIDYAEVRWVGNGIESINPIIGSTIKSVMLGQGEMTIDSRAVEVWTRLLIGLDRGWLEVFNALDKNGYAFHIDQPLGTFVLCLPVQ